MTNKVYLFDELMTEDVLLLGRYDFLNKYGKEKEPYYDKITGDYIRKITIESLHSIKQWKKREELMSKVKDWLIGMEEDAEQLSLNDWIAIHGLNHKEIWDRINSDSDRYQMDLGLND